MGPFEQEAKDEEQVNGNEENTAGDDAGHSCLSRW